MNVPPPNLSRMYLMLDADRRQLEQLIRYGDRKVRRAGLRQLKRQQKKEPRP